MKQYIALDIGGTAIKYGIYNDEYKETHSGKIPTEKDPQEFLVQIVDLVNELKNKFNIDGVAISIGGFIDPVNGKNDDHTIGDNFKAFNLKKEIFERCNITTEIENDANCAAIAEYANGAAKGIKDFCVVTVGTGIGGGIIHDGKLLRGSKFRAGEFGIMYVNHDLENGNETFTSANAMSVLVKSVSKKLDKKIDGEYIFNNLENEIIKPIYDLWLWELAMNIVNVMVCFDPEIMLVGGGVSNQEIFIEELRKRIYHLQPYLKNVPIKACELKNDAGKIGAVYHFKQMQGLV